MLAPRKPLQRKAFPKQRKPLPKVREQRRRDEGRVQQERIKERRTEPTAEQRRFHASLRGLPCQCGCGRPGECTHHLLADAPGKVGRRDHWFVVRLSHHCHNQGYFSVHLLGSEAAFKNLTGADLVAVAIANRVAWEGARRG